MAAALAIALLAASAAPASAGFRYVPPGETGAVQAEEIARSSGAADIEPPPGPGPAVAGTSVPGTSVPGTRVSGTRVWRVDEGEMLRAVLARWAARAGTEVLFLTDRRYRLDGAMRRSRAGSAMRCRRCSGACRISRTPRWPRGRKAGRRSS